MAKAMDAKERTIVDDINDGIVAADDLSIDNFTDFRTVSTGHRVVRIKLWEVVPSKEICTSYQGKIQHTGRFTKKFVRLDLHTADGEVIEAKIYEAGVAWFMRNMDTQSRGATVGKKLSEVLKYFTTHDMDIWVEWNQQYGSQIKYYDPEAAAARRMGLA